MGPLSRPNHRQLSYHLARRFSGRRVDPVHHSQPHKYITADCLIGLSRRSVRARRVAASRKRGERVKAKSRVVTFRMDQATWDFMRQLVPYTRYKKASPFIREGIELLLKREDE